ncbi:hypothetical protein [uncultured Oscillibacter sp.]|uniref:hypothetical protein n=1 Tax=uncultured Oscillibacter sp. TaxID=876091 RepID=UPI0025DA8E4F|nr:hypothetical protein [uncultured Oscillibacter sp.]
MNLMLLDTALQTVRWDATAANAAESFRQEERICEEMGSDSKAFYRMAWSGRWSSPRCCAMGAISRCCTPGGMRTATA